MRDRDDLETEREHVSCKSRLDDFGRIDALLVEMREALFQGSRRQRRESGGSLRQLRRRAKRPWRKSPIKIVFLARDTVPGISGDCNRQRRELAHR